MIELVENDDYFVMSSSKATKTVVEAPAVFAGFGMIAEEHDWNDFAGLDVEGKVVFLLAGAPKFLNSEERAHQANYKWKYASDQGAIGAVGIFTETLEKVLPFERVIEYQTYSSSMNSGWGGGAGSGGSVFLASVRSFRSEGWVGGSVGGATAGGASACGADGRRGSLGAARRSRDGGRLESSWARAWWRVDALTL